MTIDFLPELALGFLLVFARLGTMIMLMPAIGDQNVPVRIRLVFALAITLVLYAFVIPFYGTLPTALAPILFALAIEMLIGFFIGLTARMIMACMQVAGTTMAFQMGLGFAQNVDPTQGTQGALLGTFLSITGLTMIMVADLHHLFIAALRDSYILFAPGQGLPTGDAGQVIVEVLAGTFAVGVQIAAPFLVFGLLFNLGLGILSRLMPQVQIFFLGIPASIMFGFVILFAVAGTILTWFSVHVSEAVRPFLAF